MPEMNAAKHSRPVLIRADGGRELGFGHIRRCTILANALISQNVNVTWLTRSPEILPADLDTACTVEPLGSGDEGEAVLGLGQRIGASVLIGDWRETDSKLVAKLKAAGLLIVLIGNNTGTAAADLVLRQRFEQKPAPADTHVMDGADYLLVPEAVVRPLPQTARKASRMLLALGGSDNAGLEAVRKQVRESAARLGLSVDNMQAGAGEPPLTHKAIAARMTSADFAVIAAGTALHEAAAQALPAVVLPITANQKERAISWQRLGFGHAVMPENPNWRSELDRAIRQTALSHPIRIRASACMSALMDGLGARRAANAIATLAAREPALTESD